MIWLAAGQLYSQETDFSKLVQAGPMVGYVEMREVLLWVQTQGPATVRFDYFDEKNPGRIFRTAEYRTEARESYTARLVCDQVQPGAIYGYRLVLNGRELTAPHRLAFKTPENWRYRTTAPMVRFALGSCHYVNDEAYDRRGKPYGGGYEIFNSILQQQPDFMLWLGDNVYLRDADWYTRTGIQYRYAHTRALPEVQALLGSVANYAIWDDHDYGPNDSDRSYRDKELTLEAFKLFWGNPSCGLPGQGGITSMFERDDCQFFLMDNRWFRTPNGIKSETPTILGKEQLDWLVQSLVSSRATFKFVCIGGQVLNDVAKFENYINIAPAERQYLLDAIAREGIKNVIFLTGDRHHSELSVSNIGGIRIFDFTVSPLTAGSYDPEQEPNNLRVRSPNTAYGNRAFGLVEITGGENRRRLRLSLHDTQGKKIWEQSIEPQL